MREQRPLNARQPANEHRRVLGHRYFYRCGLGVGVGRGFGIDFVPGVGLGGVVGCVELFIMIIV